MIINPYILHVRILEQCMVQGTNLRLRYYQHSETWDLSPIAMWEGLFQEIGVAEFKSLLCHLFTFGSWLVLVLDNTVSVFLFVKGDNIGVLSSSHRVTSCCLSSLFLVYVAKVREDMRPTPKILRAILYKHILILIQHVNDILDYIHERQFLEMLSLYPFMNQLLSKLV